MGLQAPLWQAIAVFRIAVLVHAGLLVALNADGYAHPGGAWVVLAVMVVWTGVTVWAYAVPGLRRWPVLAADLVVVLACLVAGRWVIGHTDPPQALPALWVAAPVLAWAVHGGRRAGAGAALTVAVADLFARGGSGARVPEDTVNGAVLLLLAGFTVGHFARLAREAERRLQQAAEWQAASRERQRLARGIHDSVLQVLALVQRRGAELGGQAAVLGRLAGEQEATLRSLVAGDDAAEPTGVGEVVDTGLDLRELLGRYSGSRVTVSAPAEPVRLPARDAGELTAAVATALDNVRRHAGAEAAAWVLVEAEPAGVTVTVRDNGCGIPDGRLAQAAADGRLGVAQSIEGRMRELGGTATVTSVAGEGTEIELRLPWHV
ncbi:MAG TPA: DUF5931 domain-containing protein [Jiangellales bacterium]|nr:DUF5931 domain-containing protein [Jiangellales bacterium]